MENENEKEVKKINLFTKYIGRLCSISYKDGSGNPSYITANIIAATDSFIEVRTRARQFIINQDCILSFKEVME